MSESVTSRSISLIWDPPLPEEQNGIIQHYVLDITVFQTGGQRQVVSDNSTSFSIDQLHPYYDYSFTVSAATSIGTGPKTEAFTVRTLEEGRMV